MPLQAHQTAGGQTSRPNTIGSTGRTPTRSFVDFLVEKDRLKPGFRQVLHGRGLKEVCEYLRTHHLVAEDDINQLLAEYFGFPFTRLIDRPINPNTVKLLPRSVVERYGVLPFELKNATLSLAVTDPAMLQRDAPSALVKLRREKGLHIQLVVTPAGDAKAVLDKVYARNTSPVPPATPAVPVDTPKTQPEESESTPIASPEVHKKLEQAGKTVDLTNRTIPADVLNRVPYEVAKKYGFVVFEVSRNQGQTYEPPYIKVAVANSNDQHVKEILGYIEQRNKLLVSKYQTSPESLSAALGQYNIAEPATPNQPPKSDQPSAKPASPPPTPHAPNAPSELVTPSTHVPVSPPPVNLPEPSEEPPPKPAAPLTSQTVDPSSGAMTLSASDIVNRPTEESVKDLAKLAAQQQASLEDQNLDRLLQGPVKSIPDLADVFKRGQIPESVAAMLFLAIRMRASDVHIEAEKDSVRIRYRVDGILHDILRVPGFMHSPLIARVKILSKMKIDESRVPQDGRFDVILDHHQIDLRVSTLPTVHGEKVVMRLLDKSQGMPTLEQLGLTGSNFDNLIKNINKPYGIILSTGPTGSGKSTTLYSILNRISRPGVNIITLEDPVEYELPGLNQAQVMPQIGFTFAEGLRSVLRQDPNVIMVGEIRDLETAAMATQAALTGHLVLSTLHTNDASGALPRLIDMGVEPFLITSSLNAVIGQRLVRRVCEDCREETTIPPAILSRVQKELADVPSGQLKNVNLDQLVFYHGKGCPNCTGGYRGRIGIFEVMPMTEEIENLAVKKAPASELQKVAIKGGMVTMIQDGLIKALKGMTTVDEVMRVTMTSIKEVPTTES